MASGVCWLALAGYVLRVLSLSEVTAGGVGVGLVRVV